MKKLSIITALALLLFSNCSKDSSSSSNTLTGKWIAFSIKNLDTGEDLIDPTLHLSSITARSIVLDFQDDGTTGTISGKIGPNTAEGAYRLGSNNRFETSGLGGTKIGDNSNFNNRFRDDLPTVNRFEFKDDNKVLILWYSNNRQQIQLFKS